MRTIVIAALVLGGVTVSAAQADWQYTKWGMTPEEVAAASQGAATGPRKVTTGFDDETTQGLLEAPYQAGRYSFIARFYFGSADRKLAAVELVLQQEDTSKLRGKERAERSVDLAAERRELLSTFLQKYGRPLREDSSRTLVHRLDWITEVDSVSYLEIGSAGVLVIYKPLKTKESDAL